jgi:ethanolamine ammonia-lyase small subunit
MNNKIDNSIQKFLASQNDRRWDFSQHTHARLGLGHTGYHLPVSAWLDLQQGFAQAKDAVFSRFDVNQIASICKKLNLNSMELQSQANDAMQFLLRPDLGRLLSRESEIVLSNQLKQHEEYLHRDILIVISGGLSPVAIQKQIPFFLGSLIKKIHTRQWTLAPIIINPRGRVALGDHINDLFKSRITIMLIGERPGLTTPDSMGIYFTYNAKSGCTDAQRNCISNIHERGLLYDEAAEKLVQLMSQSFSLRISGFELKDGAQGIT